MQLLTRCYMLPVHRDPGETVVLVAMETMHTLTATIN